MKAAAIIVRKNLVFIMVAFLLLLILIFALFDYKEQLHMQNLIPIIKKRGVKEELKGS